MSNEMKKIDSIKNMAVFQDFQWKLACPRFHVQMIKVV